MIKIDEFFHLEEKSKKNVLLGNGFSISLNNSFVYSNLFENSPIYQNQYIRRIFESLNTTDFEDVIKSLEDAARIAQAHNQHDIQKQYLEESSDIRIGLINAVLNVHPRNHHYLNDDQIIMCSSFLERFSNIYTTNYDILPYWVNMRKYDLDGNYFFEDGFRWFNELFLSFNPDVGCNMFYLHGALHLFESLEGWTLKIRSQGGEVLENVLAQIGNESLPLYISEGTYAKKYRNINSSYYLRMCLDKLSLEEGVFLIYGSSLSDNDRHIYDAMFRSRASHVYICIRNKIEEDRISHSLYRYRASGKEIIFVDVSDFSPWSVGK
ncbi:DUF4917 family protein [Thalassospiraceae bacterium SW-3-3]|nr:DUF4917 family protein [Thalassospiraceae bacterium SW-3-3]